MQEQNIFVAIKDQKEKTAILWSLAKARSLVIAKSLSPRSIVFNLKAHDVDQNELKCVVNGDESDNLPFAEEVIVQFQANDEKFVAQAVLTRKSDQVKLNFTNHLFKIQRRADFRIRIPKSFSAEMKIGSQYFSVLDLSAGGCKLQLPAQLLDQKTFQGELHLKEHESIPITCEVRHKALDKTNPKMENLGIQFKSLNPRQKNNLVALVMDIYRDYFRKSG